MLKSKHTIIDTWTEDDIVNIVYFDENYRPMRTEYSKDFEYVKTFDEIEDPSLSSYRIVLELSNKEH